MPALATLGLLGGWSRYAGLKVQDKAGLIAIVDDDESVREATKGLMRSMGFATEAFSSGAEFLRSPHLDRITCLVTDVNMPDMDGLDLHRRLSALSKKIPTILITAYPSDSVRARALGEGVLCYLIKPFSKAELLKCIQFALAHGEAERGGTS